MHPDSHLLAEGRCPEPFGILGLHGLGAADEPGRIVRCFLPRAAEVELVRGDKATPMTRRLEAGLFEVEFPDETEWFFYRLRGRTFDGESFDIEDPYRFRPVLDDGHLHRFHTGVEFRAWHMLGARALVHEGIEGFAFSVWAPNARAVSLIADFNHYDARAHPLRHRGSSGVWELFIPDFPPHTCYKFSILTADGSRQERADPYGRMVEMRPRSASVAIPPSTFEWSDAHWLDAAPARDLSDSACSIYEVHLGSWRREDDPGGFRRWLTYRELADRLLPYVADLGFTHIELMPVTEHPFDGSWGYQTLGYFAPTSRFGTPDDFRHFVNRAHELDLGVILDWVPAHFPQDAHGLVRFDGTHLYEHADPRRGLHPDWGTLVFNYSRNEVVCFLLSSALYWLEEFHVDGLRVDAVASMLYLDYSRQPGQWIPNQYGGRENLEAIAFLRRMNEVLHREKPHVLVAAEESTAWPGVTQPVFSDGLGFDLKWNMGWMNDSLEYFERDPVHRVHHHDELTFSMVYAFHERFLLPLSHDEVVHGKSALPTKMPGNDDERLANLRLLYTYMWTHPGKKLLFMGGEIAQWSEWNHDFELEWSLLEWQGHRGVQHLLRELNWMLRERAALHERDFSQEGFEWIDAHDAERGTLSYLRWSAEWRSAVAVALNLTPVARSGYRLGVPFGGSWELVLNSCEERFGGRSTWSEGALEARQESVSGRPWHLEFDLPALGAVVFGAQRQGD